MRQHDSERIGPFVAGFDAYSDNLFRNYAVPDDGALPTSADVGALVAAFERRGRVPRLEYLPAAATEVLPALLNAGFVVEDQLPVMTCGRADVQECAAPDDVIVEIAVDDEQLWRCATVQNAVYGGGVADRHDVDRLRSVVDGGGHVVIARTRDEVAVGSGLITVPVGDVSELAAIGVVEQWRRRGIAAAMISTLTRAAHDTGTEIVFLMAEGPAERRIHLRVGFADMDNILLISRP
ncbi:GNAT family N-acetyltransferase [Nocardia wallacei]|uniref:GNAT family N-acetyltransferase n=1 Tax=Nocardia wallacei TaxID=480035 RepID=UPI002456F277|nr:GNAT family N-acetyltransferase [Nocardia wallacei]